MRSKSLGQAAQFNGRQSHSPRVLLRACSRASARGVPASLFGSSISISTKIEVPKSLGRRSGSDRLPKPFDSGFETALAMRDAQRIEADFDDAKRAEDHRRVDVPHMRDPERLALQVADSHAQHHAAFLLAVALQRRRL